MAVVTNKGLILFRVLLHFCEAVTISYKKEALSKKINLTV